VSHSLYFLTATLLAGQAGDARPQPPSGAPLVVESTPMYVDGQGQPGNWQPPRRGLFARIGGWFSGVFGRNRQGTPSYDGSPQLMNGQSSNGRPSNGPIIQQPLNPGEPPMPGNGQPSNGPIIPQPLSTSGPSMPGNGRPSNGQIIPQPLNPSEPPMPGKLQVWE
jgi:hypothetical protein